MPSFEVLLPLGAIGLYVFDSTRLLYSNEVMFFWRSRRWGFAMSSSLLLGGRRLWLAHPLAPAVPQFRVRWLEDDPRQDEESADEHGADPRRRGSRGTALRTSAARRRGRAASAS